MLQNPSTYLWLPDIFEQVNRKFEESSNKVYYGIITYANAQGDLSNNIKWSIYIGIKERSAMKINKKYDRSKAEQFGQEKYNVESNYDYYEMERIQAFHNYENIDDKYCMDEKVILVTDKWRKKLIEIIKVKDQ